LPGFFYIKEKSMGWLENDVALISGGGSGLGRALVERFIQEGARVGVIERDAAKVQKLAQDFGDKVCVTQGDITQYADNDKAVKATVTKFGKLDTFIANAGIFDFFMKLAHTDADKIGPAFDELMAVNVKGGILGVKAAVPELLKTRGNIIFTISNAGFYPDGGGVIYTASKHALVGVVKQLAYELAPKVRVNGVAPGGMKTELGGLKATGTEGTKLNQLDNLEDMVKHITPLHVMPAPADYCGAYVLLASRANSSATTGAFINTDGGIGMRGFMTTAGGDDL
jgi:NAD(P)-dependent dehydrogenase (short-subunit alcohol dehydrogenase family)